MLAVDNLNPSVRRGEVCGFLGPNGGGLVGAFRSTVTQRGAPAPPVSAGRGAVILAIYLVVFTVISAPIVRRRDLA